MADPVLYAHRGTNPYVDNTIDAYRWGFNYGGDYAETDFRLTKDGVVISYHDDLPGGIANLTYAQIKALVPSIVTLDELIVLTKQMEIDTGRKLGILIENKAADNATAEAIVKVLVAHDFADPERIVFQTFGSELPFVRNTLFDKYGVEFPLVQLTGALTAEAIAYIATYADGVAPTMASLTPALVAAAHAAGLTVNGWTVDGTLADVQNALNLGVDGIINDNTQLARPALEKLLRDASVAYGGELRDEINGNAGADVIYGLSGDDIVRGGAGDDVLYGDAGNDLLFGGAGNDRLVGGSGNDYLAGGTGSDVLDGGAGNDIIVATGDEVVFRAGDGIDLVSLDATSTIRLEGVAASSLVVIRDGNNLIIRLGSAALVLLDGVDPAHQPATIAAADGVVFTGAELAALAVEGSDAEVAALLPDMLALLASAPALAIPSSVVVGTDLVAEGDFPEGTLSYPIQSVETGAAYRLSFSLADLPTGTDGVRVLWGGQVVYEGVPSAAGTKLHFMVTGGAGDGSNALVFEGAAGGFGATLDALRLVKIANPVLPAPGNVAPDAPDADHLISWGLAFESKVVATDANGDTLSYLLGDGPAHGTLVFNADGTYKYTPASGFAGTDGFTYLVNDGRGGIVEAAVNFTVANSILVGTDLIVNGSFEDLSESSGNNGPSDWGYRNTDGQILGWTNVNNKRIEQHYDNYGGIVAKDGRIWIDMDHSQTGTTVDRIGQNIAGVETGATYRVSFSLSDSDAAHFDDGVIVLWNGEVIFDGLPPQTSASWTTLSFDVKGGSGNGTNRLEFIDKGVSDSWGAGAALDDVHFVKVANAGDTLPENHAPVAEDGQATGLKDAVFTGHLTAADQDAGSALVYSLKQGATHGEVFVYTDGTYRYTPAAGFVGTDSFTFLVDDGRGGKDTATFSLTVKGSTSSVAVGTDLIVNGSFEDISESGNYNGGSDWGYRNLDGQIVGWTNVNFKRIEQHLDNYGGVVAKDGKFWIDLDGAGQSARNRIGQTISLAETGATYRVSFSLSDSDNVRYDDGVTVLWNGEVIFNGLPPQTSASWTTLTFEVVGGSGNGTNRLEFIDTGVADSWGAGVALDDVHFVKIADAGDVLPANHAPEAENGAAEGLIGAVITGRVVAADQDAGSALIYSLAAAAAHGTVFVYADGTYRYTPTAGYAGEDSFTYQVDDGRGGKDTATVKLSVGVLTGTDGNDTLNGSAAADTINGGKGNDVIHGGAGNDVLSGGSGTNKLYGEAGNDTLIGGSGHNLLDGGEGDDTISAGNGGNLVFGGAGNDTVRLGHGDDIVFGGAGNDDIKAGHGDNAVDGGAGDDRIATGDGRDVIIGGAGNDTVYAGGGDDLIKLGGIAGSVSDGNDRIFGQGGADTFALFLQDRDGNAAGFGSDTIFDFSMAEGDKLMLFSQSGSDWENASFLLTQAQSGALRGTRSADGDDLTLILGTGTDARSTLTLADFFVTNAASLSAGELATANGQKIAASTLAGLVADLVKDGGSLGVSGDDYLARAHDLFADHFATPAHFA